MFIFLRHNIQNNTNKQVVYNYYRDTALQYMTYDILKEYLFNIVSYKGVRDPQVCIGILTSTYGIVRVLV